MEPEMLQLMNELESAQEANKQWQEKFRKLQSFCSMYGIGGDGESFIEALIKEHSMLRPGKEGMLKELVRRANAICVRDNMRWIKSIFGRQVCCYCGRSRKQGCRSSCITNQAPSEVPAC